MSESTFLRLWCAGGVSNGSQWLETLAAALFVFETTGSSWLVAVVSAARAVPLLLFGLGVGVLADAWNRSVILCVGLAAAAVCAATVATLAWSSSLQPIHLAVAAFVSGSAYITEFPARRRIIAESAGPASVDAAVAVDNLTSSAARCLGPVLGGFVYDHVGLGGAFALSAAANLVGAGLVVASPLPQVVRRLPLRSLGGDLRQAFAFVLRSRALLGLLAVTVTMNLFGYSYATLVTPVGVGALGLDGTQTGVLAAAEPAGALLAGIVLTRAAPTGSRLVLLMAGVAGLVAGLLAAAALGAAGAAFGLVCIPLAAGGIGSAVYSNAQTSLVIGETPPDLRSRVLGLMTVCIGSWPIGMLVAGALARSLSPLAALAVLPACALVCLAATAVLLGIGPSRRG